VKSGDCELSKVSITACLTVRLLVWMDQNRLALSVHNLTSFIRSYCGSMETDITRRAAGTLLLTGFSEAPINCSGVLVKEQ